jgi:hypothetical protein
LISAQIEQARAKSTPINASAMPPAYYYTQRRPFLSRLLPISTIIFNTCCLPISIYLKDILLFHVIIGAAVGIAKLITTDTTSSSFPVNTWQLVYMSTHYDIPEGKQ